MTQYADLKVVELKNLVKERGIASTGLKLKQHFVDALAADDDAKSTGDDAKQEVEPQEPATQAPDEAEVSKQDQSASNDVKAAEVQNTTEDSEMADDTSELSGTKRKRRSKTPPVDDEGVSKKLKTADSKEEEEQVQVRLPEDVEKAAPVPPATNVDSTDEPMSDTSHVSAHADSAEVGGAGMQDTDGASKSQHPVSKALYIRDLVRPIQPGMLRDHLVSLAKSCSTSAEEPFVKAFHLDKLRSHAFVLFTSVTAAATARVALHGKIWPDEPMRRPLFVDYVPDDKVEDWIDAELNKADNTRWEVVYSNTGLDTDGPVIATHQEVAQAAAGMRRPSSTSGPPRAAVGAGEGMPNAPSGPRQRDVETQQSPAMPAPESPAQSKQFDTLDQMFQHTQTKPKIYFKPAHKDLVDRRLAEIERETSRDWNEADADPSAYAEGELRRYTFEDGDKLVDGGADFGLFGRHPRRGDSAPRGRGRGGFRGGSRGGDYYRGGNAGRLR